jgi:putative transposase
LHFRGAEEQHWQKCISSSSEAQFKTLKYRPEFPGRFESLEHARTHLREFFAWYNEEHRHSGVGIRHSAW